MREHLSETLERMTNPFPEESPEYKEFDSAMASLKTMIRQCRKAASLRSSEAHTEPSSQTDGRLSIVTLMGSPRKRGNTARVLTDFEERMQQKGHVVDRITIVDYTVNGCLGCDACLKVSESPGCVQRDDAVAIFERMMAADVVVYATPLYCWGFSAQLKALVDRQYCLVKGYDTPDYTSLLVGTRTAMLVTCAGGIENNADVIQTIFDRENDYCRCEVVGKYILPSCTTPDAIGPQAAEMAQNMVEDICRLSLPDAQASGSYPKQAKAR
jgi:multimeric flavodoxin WrbA